MGRKGFIAFTAMIWLVGTMWAGAAINAGMKAAKGEWKPLNLPYNTGDRATSVTSNGSWSLADR